MTTFCHTCGTQAIDDKSLFCNKCGTRLIPTIPENMNDFCPKCGAQILVKDSVYCLQCGSPITENNSPRKTLSQKSKLHKPLKRTSMLLPAIVFFIAFVLVILMLSQTGILDSLFSIGSTTVNQENILNPANETPAQIPFLTRNRTPFESTIAPPEQVEMMTPSVSSTVIPTMTAFAPKTESTMKNIVETAEADGRFTTLVAAVKAAELNEMLSGDMLSSPELFTVFAPTDDAFKMLSAGSMDTLLKDPQEDLLQILLFHVVKGKVMAADLEKLTSVETLQGGSLPISVSNGVITVDGTNVVVTDVECTNGVIHVVDAVMLPPA
jgi:uncharacterized surface protein with fasciclin (FAS1) repeats/DNA-directed RNA polymerase subunit RPC12/RpoP